MSATCRLYYKESSEGEERLDRSDGLQGVCIDESHEDAMPRLVDRAWDREIVLVKHLAASWQRRCEGSGNNLPS